MKGNLNIPDINEYVNENITEFHKNRIERLRKLKLDKLLKKNPYLFKAKNMESASSLITGFMDAFLSSSEEKMFGDFLEGLAIFVSSITRGGHKSSSTGIDLEFVDNNFHYLISIKSGTNWGNNAQHNKLVDDFNKSARIVSQMNPLTNVFKILGICYGKTRTSFMEKGYWKLVGQNFWTFISGDKNLYQDIIKPIGYRAKEHNENFLKDKDKITNVMTGQFISRFCSKEGEINWAELVKYNSGNYDLDKHNLNTILS